jgi:TP901 family phage tail tape measure protein
MALSSRELLLVLRARDEASRVLRGLSGEFATLDRAAVIAARNQISAGSALVSLGAGLAYAGIAGARALYGMTQDAVEFEKQIAKVATQTDKVAVSQQELGKIVLATADDIAVPIEQLSNGLYDIFSSMDVTVNQSIHLLRSFAMEAVAGQVDMQTASRATIGILNAFHLKVDDVDKVLDVQFQLVRKGVGTFEQFAGAIGKATPSASRAGQSIETLAGMLAYLTRNGLSADMAASSAARALDALANPKTIDRLNKMGIVTRDAKGEFRDMGGIMLDLQGKLASMTAPERAAALQELFKSSGGTIQARRFYDAVLKDRESVMQFLGLVGDMNNAQGAFSEAYATMADTAAAKSQLLKNRWQAMRIEVGQALLPVFEKLLNILSELLGAWGRLDEPTKNLIINAVGIGSALSIVLGIVTSLAGAFVMLSGAAGVMGLTLGALLGIFALVVVAIGAIIAIGYLIVKNWDAITQALGKAWDWLLNNVFKPVYDWIVKNFGERLKTLWNDVKDSVVSAVQTVGDWVKRIWDKIVQWTQGLWQDVMKIIQPLVDWLVRAWDSVKDALKNILDIILSVFEGTWTAIKGVLKGAWEAISGIIEGIIDVIMGIIDVIVGIFSGDWKRAWEGVKRIFQGIWEAIWGVLKGVWDAIVGIFEGAAHILGDIISKGWNIITDAAKVVWDAILTGLKFIWDAIVQLFWELPKKIGEAIVKGFMALLDWIGSIIDGVIVFFTTGSLKGIQAAKDAGYKIALGLGQGVQDAYGYVSGVAADIVDAIHSVFSNEPTRAERDGQAITNALADGLSAAQQQVGYTAGRIIDAIKGVFGPAAQDAIAKGQAITKALADGMASGQANASGTMGRIAAAIRGAADGISLYNEGAAITRSLGEGLNSQVSWLKKLVQSITAMIPANKGPMEKDRKLLRPAGIAIMQGLIKGINSQRDALRYALHGVAGDINGAGFGDYSDRPTANNPLPYTYAPGGGIVGGTYQSIQINTPEIVPARDAAILGYELSRRVG